MSGWWICESDAATKVGMVILGRPLFLTGVAMPPGHAKKKTLSWDLSVRAKNGKILAMLVIKYYQIYEVTHSVRLSTEPARLDYKPFCKRNINPLSMFNTTYNTFTK